MWKNYLKTALRSLWKNKLYSSINIGGLALGMAVAVLIFLYVKNELSYDQWLPDRDQVYRIYREWQSGGNSFWTPDPLAEQLVADFPEVIQAAGLSSNGETLLEYQQHKLYVESVALVDSTFLEVIQLPLIHGNPLTALRDPNAVLISQRVARLFFGSADPVGQTLRFNDEFDLVVNGVIAPLENTHLPFEVYTRFNWENTNWNSNNRATYLKLVESSGIPKLEQKLTEHINRFKIKKWKESGVNPTAGQIPFWKLQPIEEVHLHAAEIYTFGGGGDIKYVYIFSVIAFIVLLIGAINYINLSTARSISRAKEVGVRKVTGARRNQLITQFLVETVTQTGIALLLTVFLVELLLPGFNQICNRELAFLGGDWPALVLPMLGLMIVVGLVAGSYPAFVLSGFRPVKVLKGVVKGKGAGYFRKGLVITQFFLSVALIIVMLFIHKQLNFMLEKDLGFAGDQVVVIPFNMTNSYRKMEGMRDAFLNIPGVVDFSTTSRLPGQAYPDWSMHIQGKEEVVYPRVLFTDEYYDELLQLELVDGRYLSSAHPGDTANAYVVNEAFVRENNLENPVGHQVRFTGTEEYGRIIGVVRDYHYQGVNMPISPLIIGGGSRRYYAALKISSTDIETTMGAVLQLWRKVEPSHPMRYTFLSEDFANLYEEYKRFGLALLYSTILAILVAILGLFGLTAYAATTRIKEIGVRKILGASVSQLSFMLVKDFLTLILLAGVIAVPVGFLIARNWLEDFAYRTELSALPFIGAIGAALLIAGLTVSTLAIRAASRNPVDALRYE